MAAILLEDIPVKLDPEIIRKELRVRDNEKRVARFNEMVEQARKAARPRAVLREAFVDMIDSDSVILNGIAFKSRVMASNLKGVGRVFAYVATCGTEADEWAKGFESVLERFWADSINEYTLYKASEYMVHYIANTFELGKPGMMNPGSLPDWPVAGQVQLFLVVGDVERLIGVKLTKGMLLVPVKSVSGIIFPSDINYVNCMLCTKNDCKGRRSEFNEQLYREKLG